MFVNGQAWDSEASKKVKAEPEVQYNCRSGLSRGEGNMKVYNDAIPCLLS